MSPVNYSGTEFMIWADDGYDDFKVRTLQVSVAPEPISSTLFVIGAATMGFRRFRKQFKK